jgi:AcrR family transcriptional regulator
VPSAEPTATAAPPARPMRADARRNYDRLIETARALLTERSGEVSLEEIAKGAGVGIGTLYRHFPTRLDLLEAVYREDVEALWLSAQSLASSEPEWDALDRWLHLYIGYAATKRVLFQELVEAVGKDSALLTHSRQVINTAAGELLGSAQQAGVARADVEPSDLLRLVGGCTMMPHLEPGQQERMLQIVLDGIRT